MIFELFSKGADNLPRLVTILDPGAIIAVEDHYGAGAVLHLRGVAESFHVKETSGQVLDKLGVGPRRV